MGAMSANTIPSAGRVLVYGAAGHTGRFVVRELLRRGIVPVLAGRNATRLQATARELRPRLEQRSFDLSEPSAVEAGLAEVDVVVNCAGPFLDTALPLATAAVATGAHYLDVTAEQPVVRALYEELDRPAKQAGVAVVPAMAFYGGLADLMVTAVLDGDEDITDGIEVTVAIALDHWWPTAGTRLTGKRNTSVRQVVRDGALVPLANPAPTATWSFPGPLGDQAVVELPFSEGPAIYRHLRVDRLTSYLNTGPLAELRDTDTPAPNAADGSGRSVQRFVVDVVVRRDGTERRITASGRDIYAVTAPIITEGVARLLDGRSCGVGALAPGSAFDAVEVTRTLVEHPYGVRLDRPA